MELAGAGVRIRWRWLGTKNIRRPADWHKDGGEGSGEGTSSMRGLSGLGGQEGGGGRGGSEARGGGGGGGVRTDN
jgi:hypothetical protein